MIHITESKWNAVIRENEMLRKALLRVTEKAAEMTHHPELVEEMKKAIDLIHQEAIRSTETERSSTSAAPSNRT